MQPFTIAAFTFGTKNGTVPEIGTYKIIGFSVANELSIGIDLNKRMLRRLRGLGGDFDFSPLNPLRTP